MKPIPGLTDEEVRKWMDAVLTRLAPAEVNVPRRYTIHTDCTKQCPTECFVRAAQYVELHRVKDIRYVFGQTIGGGIQQHGWVEIGNVVFDGVLQRFYDKDQYYDIEHATPWYRFTRAAVLWCLNQRFESWRWASHLGLPWAKSAHDKTAPVLLVDRKDAETFAAAHAIRHRDRRNGLNGCG